MPFTAAEIRQRLRLGEDNAWEFKQIEFRGNHPVRPSRDDLADEIGAFTNAAGGVLLCGVTDAGMVQGMTRAQMDNLERLLVEVCQDTIKPRLNMAIYRIAIAEDDAVDGVLLAEVPEGYAAHTSPGGVWQRVGSSKRRLDNDEVLRLAQKRGQARFVWYDEQPVAGTGFASLDEALWKPLLTATGAADPEIGLSRMHLLTTDERGVTRASVAGLLICSNAPEQWLSNAYITATRYMGNDRASRQIDTQDIYGPVQKQIRQALAFVIRNMQVAADKTPARVNLPQYSEKALFEAIVNAVVHRDYSIKSSRIRIAMFDDRVEINSPGSLPNNLTINSMANLQATRNEVLASLLGRIPTTGIAGASERQYIMERRGDGITIIRRETEELCQRLPEFELVGSSEFKVTIPAAVTAAGTATIKIALQSARRPVSGADVLILLPNQGPMSLVTDAEGRANVKLHINRLLVTMFVAAQNCYGFVFKELIDSDSTIILELEQIPDGGTVIIRDGIGTIPGLTGRVNPIRDEYDRVCLYATDITSDGGKPQPVHFIPGEELRLTDSNARQAVVRIIDIVGRSSLVEYHSIPKA